MAGIISLDPGDPEQRFEITLEEFRYEFRVRWNSRDDEGLGAWYLDIYDAGSHKPLALSLKLVLGVLIARHVLGGALMMVDYSGTGDEARLDDLGSRVKLWYLGPDDIEVAQLSPSLPPGVTPTEGV